MFVMAIAGLILLCLSLINQFSQFPTLANTTNQIQYPKNQCTNEDIFDNFEQNFPKCVPRPTLVSVPRAFDFEIKEIIPSKVEVKRCDGVCHDNGNSHHKCIPTSTTNTTFNVRKLYFTLLNWFCSRST